MSEPALLVTRPREDAALLTLNRPDRLNALTSELVAALHDALDELSGDRSCRAIVITGAGRAFCAGLDLAGYGTAPGADGSFGEVGDRLASQRHMSGLFERLRDVPKPVIAAVNGAAAGGGLALVLASDIRIAARSAVFRAAFANIGVSNCDMGTSWLLPRIVGAARAQELMLTARRIDADEAERIGLVVAVHDDGGALLDAAFESVDLVAGLSPTGVAMTKQGMWTALETPALRTAIEYEDRQQVLLTLGPDMPEAITAFLEKRPPRFGG
jgi:enoyl-CoA hydratase